MKAKSKLYSILLSIVIITCNFKPVFATPKEEYIIDNDITSSNSSHNEDIFNPKISIIDDILNPTFIAGELTEKSADSPENIVEKYYNKDIFADSKEKPSKGLIKNDNFKFTHIEKKSSGMTELNVIQTYNEVPVFGTEQNFNVNEDGIIECIVGSKVEDISNKLSSSTSIQISEQDALNAVENDLAFKPVYSDSPKIELALYPLSDKYVYAYMVSIDYNYPQFGGYTYYVNANDRSILKVLNYVLSDEHATTGTGIGQVDSEVKNLNMVFDDSNTYFLEDTVRNFKTMNFSNIRYSEPDNNFDSGNSSNYQKDAVDAHYNIANVFDFYAEILGRHGIRNDSRNLTYNVTIDETSSDVNAYAYQNNVRFLSGHGKKGRSLACCLDVAGHEFTHGIMLYEGLMSGVNTEYGAMHEGLADVFGTLCEFFKPSEGSFDWMNAEDAGVPFRDCSNPLIDDYDDYLTKNPENHDGGGVITKAAYLIAEGGTHNGKEVTAIDTNKDMAYTKLGKIFYYVIDNNLIPYMNFEQFANAAVDAANKLYGIKDSETVSKAFEAVGVLLKDSPKNFTETARDGMSISFSWEGIPGETYAIYRSDGYKFKKYNNTTSFTGIGEIKYGTNNFYVARVDSAGNRISSYSNAVTIVLNAEAPQLSMTRDGNKVTFNWNSVCDNYFIYGTLYGKKVYGELTSKTTATFYIKTIGSYYFYVEGQDSNYHSCSTASNQIIVETAAAPKNLVMTSKDGLNIQLSWDGTIGNNYAIYRKVTGSSDTPVRLDATTTNTTFSTSTLDGSYDYYVAQLDSYGYRNSDFSNPVKVDALLTAPADFRISQRSGLQCGFSWKCATGSYYAIYRKVAGSTDEPIRITNPSTDNIDVGASTLVGKYDFYVAQVDLEGNRISEYSKAVTVES